MAEEKDTYEHLPEEIKARVAAVTGTDHIAHAADREEGDPLQILVAGEEPDPHQPKSERVSINVWVVHGTRYTNLRFERTAPSEPWTETIESIQVSQITRVQEKAGTSNAEVDVQSADGEYTTWIPRPIAEAIIRAS